MIIHSTKKQLKVVFICITLALVFIIGFIIYNFFKYNNYKSVEATVLSVSFIESGSETDTSNQKYITVEYTFENKEYISQKRIGIFEIVSEGSTTTIRCNPDNPSEIEDIFLLNTLFFLLIILVVFDVLLIISLSKKGKYS